MTALKDFVLGIELGSTRIKAVLLDKAHRPVASGSYSWENGLKDGVWTYSLEDAEKGLQACFADLRQDAEGKLGEKLSPSGGPALLHHPGGLGPLAAHGGKGHRHRGRQRHVPHRQRGPGL